MSSYAYIASNPLLYYLPLGYNKLKTTLLTKERENVDKVLQPIKGT